MGIFYKNENYVPISGCGTEIYSQEEVLIGTWVDGNPLYRKVVVVEPGQLASQQVNKYITVGTFDNTQYEVQKIGGVCNTIDGYVVPVPISYTTSAVGTGISLHFKKSSGELQIAFSFDAHKNGKTYIFVEYTKTGVVN